MTNEVINKVNYLELESQQTGGITFLVIDKM